MSVVWKSPKGLAKNGTPTQPSGKCHLLGSLSRTASRKTLCCLVIGYKYFISGIKLTNMTNSYCYLILHLWCMWIPLVSVDFQHRYSNMISSQTTNSPVLIFLLAGCCCCCCCCCCCYCCCCCCCGCCCCRCRCCWLVVVVVVVVVVGCCWLLLVVVGCCWLLIGCCLLLIVVVCCCWLLVVGCWLLVVGCWLLVVGCWLLVVVVVVVGCWLLVVGCWLLVVVACSLHSLAFIHAFLTYIYIYISPPTSPENHPHFFNQSHVKSTALVKLIKAIIIRHLQRKVDQWIPMP